MLFSVTLFNNDTRQESKILYADNSRSETAIQKANTAKAKISPGIILFQSCKFDLIKRRFHR